MFAVRPWPKKFQHTAARRRLGLSQKPCSVRFSSPDSLNSQEKREREYNTAFSVTLAFTIY